MNSFIERKIINNGKNKNKKTYYHYYQNKKKITNVKIIEKCSKIYIPPAYKNVKIYLDQPLLGTGYDSAGRKQYIYDISMKKERESKKYSKLIKISTKIIHYKEKIKKDIDNKKMSKNKIIAIMLKIMDICGFRVGNKKYEKLYGSYGMTTLKKKHVSFNKKKKISISFIGKKKVLNQCWIEDPHIIKYIQSFYSSCSHSNEYIFNYKKVNITMQDINLYLKEFGFTCKDLRTWNANISLLCFLKESLMNRESPGSNYKITQKDKKKILKECIEKTAILLHHTSTISKSSYLYKPLLEDFINTDKCYQEIVKEDSMEKYMRKLLSKK